MYFLFSKAGNFETSITQVPYNKLLTNLACSGRTGEYWPLVIFVQTELRSVRTATTLGQYSPVRPSHSVSKRLLLSNCSEYCPNNSTNIQRCCAVICYSRKPVCGTGWHVHSKLSHSPPFIDKFINYSRLDNKSLSRCFVV